VELVDEHFKKLRPEFDAAMKDFFGDIYNTLTKIKIG
jgi:hypothetical protein